MIVNKHKYLIRKNCFKELLQGISKKGQFYLPRKALIFMMCILLTYSSLSVDIVLFKYLKCYILSLTCKTNKQIHWNFTIHSKSIQRWSNCIYTTNANAFLYHYNKESIVYAYVMSDLYASLRNYKD